MSGTSRGRIRHIFALHLSCFQRYFRVSASYEAFAIVFRVKTLVIAEKPSVARDLTDALPGPFSKNDTHFESDVYVISFAVGHLVELVNPEEYDEKLKKWRMADLPIIPEEFRLHARDKKAEKQLKVIHKLMKRDDVERIINACDAGREGELIFAYIYETAGSDKPVDRLWINSMTKQAIREGFERLRPGEQLQPLEAAALSSLRRRLRCRLESVAAWPPRPVAATRDSGSRATRRASSATWSGPTRSSPRSPARTARSRRSSARSNPSARRSSTT